MILKTLYKTLLRKSHPWFSKVRELPIETTEIHSSLFAGIILVPKEQLKKASHESFAASNISSSVASNLA